MWRSPAVQPNNPAALGGHHARVTGALRSAGSRLSPLLSYDRCYVWVMAHTITFRPDEDALRALALLTQDGASVSTVVRGALIDAARHRAEQRLRAEAELLAADEGDRAEAAQVLRDMETLRAW